MPRRSGSSSLHYDPYENLLCVVCGSKTVRCFSPEATPCMYPLPLWGESPNHSSVNFAAPDLARHPLYARALDSMLTAELEVSASLQRRHNNVLQRMPVFQSGRLFARIYDTLQ